MIDYNFGTAMNKLIIYYEEMLELIIQARLASDRIDEWKEVLDLVTNPDQTVYDIDTNIPLDVRRPPLPLV